MSGSAPLPIEDLGLSQTNSHLRGRLAARAGALSVATTLAVGVAAAPSAAAPAPVQGSGGSTLIPHGPVLRVTPSEAPTYVARGTLPLGPGWTWEPDCPFALRRNDSVYPCQWWPVALDNDGNLAVVELAATVPGKPDLGPDPDPIEFEVVRRSDPYKFLLPDLDPNLLDIVDSLGKLRLQINDSHGNIYAAPITQPLTSPDFEVEVVGRSKLVIHTDAQLQLVKAAKPGALPRLGGIQAWITLYDSSPVAELDLRWHNATVGPVEHMTPNVLFDSVELVMPLGMRATPRWPLPTSGPVYDVNLAGRTKSALPLVAEGATPHVLRQRGNLTWRVAVHPQGVDELVEDFIARRGWGTVRGSQGGWQDPYSRSWLAQRTLLPDLSHWEDQMEQELEDTRTQIETAFANGTPYYYTDGGVGQMGPFHSIGVKYGGMTSGSEIFQTPGADLIWTAEPDGLFKYEALHRMVHDRQYGWFYDQAGELLTGFHLVPTSNALPINVFNNEFLDISNNGALGFELVPDTYADVQPRPTYEDDMLGTDPYNGLDQYDTQHGIRATYPSKVLVWAANDRMARHDLIAQASMWHMELHDGPGGRLRNIVTWGAQHPNVAGEFGRGEAWAVDGLAHWYALGTPAERTLLDPWFDTVVEALAGIRTPLGVFYGNRTGKITDYYDFNGQYAITQWFEHEILLHSLTCMLESWAPDAPTEVTLADWLVEGTLACWNTGWKQGTNGTYEQQAVAWMDPNLAAFATPEAIPANGTGGGPDQDQLAGPVGLALVYASPDQAVDLLSMAQAITEDPNPLMGLESLYTYYLAIENRAPLVAWLQVVFN